MKKRPSAPASAAVLRRRAVAELKARQQPARSKVDAPRFLQELQIHQVELEMQNEELCKTRDELATALERYTELYDFAPVGYLSLDPSGVIRRANLTAASLLGTARSQLLERRFGRFVAPKGRAAFNTLLAKSFETKTPQEADVQLQVEGRPPLTVHVRAAALDDGRECQIVLTDLTRRIQMEEELRRSERLFRLDFEEAPVGRCLVGLDGRFLKTNAAFCALQGRSEHELGGLNFLEITHPEDRQASAEGVRQLLEGTLSRLDLEKRCLTSERRMVWTSVRVGLLHDDAGAPLHFSFFVQDISKRKQAEAALLERDEQLRSIASSIPGALYQFVRKPDGSVEIPFMSAGARLLFDRPLEELQDPSHLFDDVHPDDVPGLWASIEASAKDLMPWSVEFRLVPKTAPLRWLRGASNPRRLPDGGICWNGVLLDITEQKRGDEQTRLQHRLALALVAASDLQQGLRLSVESAIQATGMDSGGFYLVEESSGALDFLVPHGLSSEFVQAVSRYEATSDHTRSVLAGSPIYARFEDLGLSLSEAERREGLRFIAVLPLHHEGKVIGCMNVASHTVDDLPLASRQVLETIAATATQAIARLRAEERLLRSEALLNHTQRLSKLGGWEWDLVRQTMVWTEEMYRLHDLSAQEIAPGSDEYIRRSAACYAPEHQAAILKAFHRCVERGEAYDLEVPFTSVKGRSMWVRTTAQAVWEGNRIVRVVGNLMDITERKQAEVSLRQLSARLLQMQDEARRQLARELHDTTAQDLAALVIHLQVVSDLSEPRSAQATKMMGESLKLAEKCAHEIRTQSFLLHPPLLDELGLAGAIRDHLDGFAHRTGLRVNLSLPRDLARLPSETELALFRVLQEALSNIHRHSGSQTASITLTQTAEDIRLEVRDQGRGMGRSLASQRSADILSALDEQKTRPVPHKTGSHHATLAQSGPEARAPGALTSPESPAPRLGVGISGMKERMHQLGGRLEIQSSAQGTCVLVILPRPARLQPGTELPPTTSTQSARGRPRTRP